LLVSLSGRGCVAWGYVAHDDLGDLRLDPRRLWSSERQQAPLLRVSSMLACRRDAFASDTDSGEPAEGEHCWTSMISPLTPARQLFAVVHRELLAVRRMVFSICTTGLFPTGRPVRHRSRSWPETWSPAASEVIQLGAALRSQYAHNHMVNGKSSGDTSGTFPATP
jgi:hypothetical protein